MSSRVNIEDAASGYVTFALSTANDTDFRGHYASERARARARALQMVLERLSLDHPDYRPGSADDGLKLTGQVMLRETADERVLLEVVVEHGDSPTDARMTITATVSHRFRDPATPNDSKVLQAWSVAAVGLALRDLGVTA